jgi:hypothetical protein
LDHGQIYDRLGAVYCNLREIEEGIKFTLQGLKIFKNKLGKLNVRLLSGYANIGGWYL